MVSERPTSTREFGSIRKSWRRMPAALPLLRAREISISRSRICDYKVALSFDPDKKQVGGREAAEGIARVEQKLAAKASGAKSGAPQAAVTLPPAAPGAAKVVIPIGRRVALVIGNGKYRYAAELPNPSNDAADIAKALGKLGFDVVEGRDLDKRAMEDKIREFGRKLERADLALLFYAGHGLQVGGRNYLVPVDAKLERAGDLSLDTIEVGQILAQMEAEKRVNLVFLDACRDNPLARSFSRTLGARSTAVGSGLAAIQSAVGTMIAYATQPDNVALDGDGRNSPFTAALLKHIATPALEISALMKRVRADVIAATRERQVGWGAHHEESSPPPLAKGGREQTESAARAADHTSPERALTAQNSN